MEDAYERSLRVASWTGYPLGRPQFDELERYAAWLEAEALPAGGIGPAESGRIWDRHICDSLAFAAGWPTEPPALAIDVGSGVGLPGVPLAILWPCTHFVLLDRSGRRTELLRRMVRVNQIENVDPVNADLADMQGTFEGIVARGVMDPGGFRDAAMHLIGANSRIVVGLTRRSDIADSANTDGTVLHVPPEVLDGGAQILIIEPRDG